MAETTVQESAALAPATREATPPTTRENTVAPAVDIFETPDGLTLFADMPGIGKDDLDVRVEEGVLTIRGRVRPERREDAMRREFGLVNYFRQFQLNEDVESEKIVAELKQGVLRLHLPKPEKARPRRIPVKVG